MKRIAYLAEVAPGEERSVPAELLDPAYPVETVYGKGPRFPGDAVELMLKHVTITEAALRAEAAGFDAVLIGGMAAYGGDAVRAAVRIPAIGCGEASMLVAAGVGRRFSIVTIWPRSTAHVYRELVEAARLGERCGSVRYVVDEPELATLADDENFYTRMRAGEERMLARICAQIDAAVADDGADAVILGCNCMTPIAGALADRVEVPVIDPTAASYRYLTMLLSLGLAQSPVAFPPAREDRAAMLGAIADVARAHLESAPEPTECGDACAIQPVNSPS